MDGSIIRFLVVTDKDSGDSQGKVVTHPVPPAALCWLQGHILAAGCDKRILIYNSQAKIVKTFDYSRENGEYEFTLAAASPSGQVSEINIAVYCSIFSIFVESIQSHLNRMEFV